MTSLAEAFGLGRGCFGREGVLRCTGTFPGSYRAQAARASTRFISKAYKLPLQRSVQVPFAMDKPPSNLGKGSIKLFQKVTSFLAVTARDHADS